MYMQTSQSLLRTDGAREHPRGGRSAELRPRIHLVTAAVERWWILGSALRQLFPSIVSGDRNRHQHYREHPQS